ncbi:DUF1778 domain-containing protein [Telmatospirillum sp.]|uniref:type II toxin-antitoxin system TacA family antitoxin n=1 Tax=Telmatospirillum sp. TaxID=2079197 RepID=UPI0028414946|nr:DUF1778 domain-containing protein [Telmatospirillum sp.]MDR3435751.1 DUF1778 domain-containing protein [Telmatospirillum sp.]
MPQARPPQRKATSGSTRKGDIIQIRASAETKVLLHQAAVLRGQKLSEFVLESARKQAEETLLDQRVFFLEPEAHEDFLTMLDAPALPSDTARERLNRRAHWDR